jgi:hypothetical protein
MAARRRLVIFGPGVGGGRDDWGLHSARWGYKLSVMKRGKLPPDVLRFFQEEGRKGGKIGGKIGGPAAAAAMTPAERTARAKKAAAASAKVRSKAAKKRKA